MRRAGRSLLLEDSDSPGKAAPEGTGDCAGRGMSFGLWSGVVGTAEGGKGEGRDAAPQEPKAPLPLGLHSLGVSLGKGLPQPVPQRGKPELSVGFCPLLPAELWSQIVVEEGKEREQRQGWWEQRWGTGEGAVAISYLPINLLPHCLFKSIMNGGCR